jgi:hypothetical protein
MPFVTFKTNLNKTGSILQLYNIIQKLQTKPQFKTSSWEIVRLHLVSEINLLISKSIPKTRADTGYKVYPLLTTKRAVSSLLHVSH